MNIRVQTRITHNRIPEIVARFPGAVSAIVHKVTWDILDVAHDEVPIDTGYLANSTGVTVLEEFRGEVSSGAEYAAYVEYGTYKMGAQPYLKPAADKNEPKFVEAMERLLGSL